jgi:cell fate regulator YaaT (PSP1 superfamily)
MGIDLEINNESETSASDRQDDFISFDDNQESQDKRGHKIKRNDGPKVIDTLCRRTINVRMRIGGQLQTFDCRDLEIDLGDWVVVRFEDVVRLGMVTSKPIIWPQEEGKKGIFLPSDRQLLRVATVEDLSKQAENQIKEREDFEYCQNCINHQGLSMKLVAVEITFDNYKTIFYYTAEERVDFRQLVRELVSRFRTRIEMRQIGVRNEALMLGGIGLCGRNFCCSSFLNTFLPVSVKMAKEQNISLNTAKISGVCGRLMCCLAYENPTDDENCLSGEQDCNQCQRKTVEKVESGNLSQLKNKI